jgi:hypothetical protein
MEPLSLEQWQWLWFMRANTSRDPNGDPQVRDFLFELMTEAGYDVRDDVVVKLA